MDIDINGRTFRVKPEYEGLIEQGMQYQWFRDQLEWEAGLRQSLIDAPFTAPRGSIQIPVSAAALAAGAEAYADEDAELAERTLRASVEGINTDEALGDDLGL